MKNVWLLVLACICMTACRNRQQSAEVTNYDLPQIKDSGELVVLTLNSSTSYFDYRGEPMGFQYELADQFARSLDVKLKIKVAQNARDLVHRLLQGEGDLSSDGKEIRLYNKRIDFENGVPVKVEAPDEIIPYEKKMPLEEELRYFVEHLDSTIGINSGEAG